MKKKASIRITLIVISLAIAALFISCQNPDEKQASALNGTWVRDTSDYDDDPPENIIIFNDGNFEMKYDGISQVKGTYTASNGLLTLTFTHLWGPSEDDSLEARWYSKAEIKQIDKKEVEESGEEWNEKEFERRYAPYSTAFSVSGKTLYLGDDKYIKK
ncbi:MAG: hypothetical protein LBC76_10675 [Treponema sp.]|jgi:hypothetical protein|nr:hypothetical protein [Treponema sp.]